MAGRSRTVVQLAFMAACVGCGSDQVVAPYKPGDGATGGGATTAPIFTYVEVSPDNVAVVQGRTEQLTVGWSDQSGEPMSSSPDTISYSSSVRDVATVSNTGVVTGVAPGVAYITATVNIGGRVRQGGTTVHVFSVEVPDELVLRQGLDGWPVSAQVAAGGLVQWHPAPASSPGATNTMLYLFCTEGCSAESWVIERPIVGGSVTYTFDTPNTLYHYCTGACWDPIDGGLIYVR